MNTAANSAHEYSSTVYNNSLSHWYLDPLGPFTPVQSSMNNIASIGHADDIPGYVHAAVSRKA